MLGQFECAKALGTHTQLNQGKLYHSHPSRCNLQGFHKGWVQCIGTDTVYSHLLGEALLLAITVLGGKHFKS